METETTHQSRKRNDSRTVLNQLCLVCPLSDCFQKSKGCLQRAENRARGMSLLAVQEQQEKRFGNE